MEYHLAEQVYDVSVSVVTYETDPEELALLLDSLRAGTTTVLITVIDNSPSASLQSVVENSGAVYVRPGCNLGFGAGHNLALRRNLQRAPFQLVVNPDITVHPGAIDTLLAFMQTHADIGQLMPAVCYPDGSEQRLTKRLPTPADLFLRRFLSSSRSFFPSFWERYEMRDVDLSLPSIVPCLSGCFMLMRSAVLEKVGIFDERYFMYMEDVDLCRRIGAVSRTVFYPEVSVIHGYAMGSYRNPKLLKFHLRSAIRYFNKWGWIFDRGRTLRNRCASAFPGQADDTSVIRVGNFEGAL
jgi:GT2 family glycosyltransferase